MRADEGLHGVMASCGEAAPRKSGENDSMRLGLWRKCVEKVGSGLRAADKRRLCAVETYPSASATTTLEPQAGGDKAAIDRHPRRGGRRAGAAMRSLRAGCEAVCDLKSGRWSHSWGRQELPGRAAGAVRG